MTVGTPTAALPDPVALRSPGSSGWPRAPAHLRSVGQAHAGAQDRPTAFGSRGQAVAAVGDLTRRRAGSPLHGRAVLAAEAARHLHSRRSRAGRRIGCARPGIGRRAVRRQSRGHRQRSGVRSARHLQRRRRGRGRPAGLQPGRQCAPPNCQKAGANPMTSVAIAAAAVTDAQVGVGGRTRRTITMQIVIGRP